MPGASEKAAIYWSDETGVCNQDQIGRGYAPKGQAPVLTRTGQKFSPSMIAAVSNRGLMRFRLYKGALNVTIFIDFMKRLVKDAKQKIYLIVDNLRRPSRQGRPGLAGAPQGRNRDLLPPGLRAGAQPGRISQQRSETDDQDKPRAGFLAKERLELGECQLDRV
jgi:hypothetical protein